MKIIKYSTDRLITEKRIILNRPLCLFNSGLTITGNSNMKTIQLTQGKVALVDDEDFEELNKHKWYASKDHHYTRWYAGRAIRIDGKKYTCLMHRDVMNAPKDKMIDHINHDGLDNRKCNLRVCSNSQNQCNMLKTNKSSKYKGVHLRTYNKKQYWCSQIVKNGKKEYIGIFNNEIDAAKAYDKRAKEAFGEFSYCNFS